MPIYPTFEPVLLKTHEINFTQCYPGGQLKYTDLCNLLQLTAGEHAALGGLSFNDMQPLYQAWVLQKMSIKILELPYWKEVVQLKTFVTHMEAGTSTRVIELYRDNLLLVQAITNWAVMDTQKRRATILGLPFEHFLKHDITIDYHPNSKELNFNKGIELQKDYTIALSDLDILGHANNVKYLEWCLNFYDSNEVITKPIEQFEMQFIRELKEGDSVKILQSYNHNRSYFEIERAGKKCFELNLIHKKNLPKEV